MPGNDGEHHSQIDFARRAAAHAKREGPQPDRRAKLLASPEQRAMRILISTPTNGNPALIRDQVLAYNSAIDSECVHIIHVSRDAKQKGVMQSFDATRIGNVLINDHSYFSRTPSILGIHILNVEFALRSGIDFSHIYLHTASDLPFRRGLGSHIFSYDFGMSSARTVDLRKTAGWTPAVADHRPIQDLASMFDGTIYTTRTEGFFCSRDLFFEIMWYAKLFVNFDRENIWRGNYPYEEYLLPTVVEHLLGPRKLRRTRNSVITTTSHSEFNLNSRERINVEHIPILQNTEKGVFAFKFAPDDIDSPVRKWVRNELGYSNELLYASS